MSYKTVNAHTATSTRLNQNNINNARIHNALQARHNINDSLNKARNAKKVKKTLTSTHKSKRKHGRISQESNVKRRQAKQRQSIVNSTNDLNKLIKSLNAKIQEYSAMQEIDQCIMCVSVVLQSMLCVITVYA